MLLDDVRTLFGYNAWANTRILDAAARVPTEEFATVSLGPCRLHDTLRHILMCEIFWRAGWQGVDNPSDRLPEVFPTLDALRARWQEENQYLQVFLSTLSDADLRRPMVSLPDPPETLGQQLQHVVIHGTQHRSEVALLLTGLGHSPGFMDFLPYVNARDAGTA